MAYTLFATLRDGKDRTSITTINLAGTDALEDVQAAVAEFAAAVVAMTDAECINAGFTWTLDQSDLPADEATASSDVEEKALFIFETAAFHKTRVSVPAAMEAIFVDETDQVDQTEEHVSAFLTKMITGWTPSGGTAAVHPSDARDEDITSLVEGRKTWARARR